MVPKQLFNVLTKRQYSLNAFIEKKNKNKTRMSKVGAIFKALRSLKISKYAQDVFMKSSENSFKAPTQRVPFMLDKTPKPLFPQLKKKQEKRRLKELKIQ